MAENLLDSAIYIYYFCFMLSNLSAAPEDHMIFSVFIAAFQTLWSICTDNYLTHRSIIEKEHLQKKEVPDDKEHKKWRVS